MLHSHGSDYKGTFFSDVMACSLVQIYWGLEEPTTCTLMMKSVGSPAIAINFTTLYSVTPQTNKYSNLQIVFLQTRIICF